MMNYTLNYFISIEVLWVLIFINSTAILNAQSKPNPFSDIDDGYYLLERLNDYNNEPNKCLKLFERTSDIFYEEENWRLHAHSLCGIANCNYLFFGDYPQFSIYMDSLQKFEPYYSARKDSIYFSIQNSNVIYYTKKGRFDKCIDILEEATKYQDSISNKELRTVLVDKLAEAYTLNGDYIKAKQVHLENIKIKEVPLTIAKSHYFISRLEAIHGDYMKALMRIDSAISILVVQPSSKLVTRDLAISRVNEVEYLIRSNNTYKAKEKLQHLLTSSSEYIPEVQSMCYKHSSELALLDGNTREALSQITIAQSILLSREMKETAIDLALTDYVILESRILRKIGKYNDAKIKLESILRRLGVNNNFDDLNPDKNIAILKYLEELAELKLEIGVNTSNPEDYSKAVDVFIKIRKLISIQRTRNTNNSYLEFWASVNSSNYQKAIAACIFANRTNEAFGFMEENKSNLLVKSINESYARGFGKIPKPIIIEEKELRSTIRENRDKLLKLNKLKDFSTGLIEEATKNINKSQVSLDALIDNIEKKYPQYYKMKYRDKALTIQDVQEELDHKTLFIEYFIAKKEIYIQSITSKDSELIRLPITEECRSLVKKFKRLCRDPGSTIEMMDTGQDLYKLILKPCIKKNAHKPSSIIIVQDDFLSNFPFELLVIDSSDTFLYTEFDISYQYSGKLLKILEERTNSTYDYDLMTYNFNENSKNIAYNRTCLGTDFGQLICGNKEVQYLKSILARKNIYEEKVSQYTIIDSSISSKVLHMATHSCLNQNNPTESKILFGDSYVTIQELETKEFETELIVLSSCESGFGKVYEGEGSLSIAKSFFQAGCKSAVVSLWPVDDCSTAEVMKYFYQGLAQGKRKDTALTLAKMEYQNSAHPSRIHPYYWAGFIVIGDIGPVWTNSTNSRQIIIILSISILVFGLISIWKSKNQ